MKYYDDIGYRKGSNLACSDKAAALLSLRKQCAWCLIDLDTGIRLTYKDLDASHEICDSCLVEMLKNADYMQTVMGNIANMLKTDNPRFDRPTFYAACESGTGHEKKSDNA